MFMEVSTRVSEPPGRRVVGISTWYPTQLIPWVGCPKGTPKALCPRSSPVGVLKAVSSCSSLRCVTWGSLGSSSPVSESVGEEQRVRGHEDQADTAPHRPTSSSGR